MNLQPSALLPLTQTTLYEADGFSLSLTCQVSSSAQERELQAWSPPGKTSCMPESVRQTMLDRLGSEAKKMLCEAHPRLLAGLVAVACEYQSELNDQAIVADEDSLYQAAIALVRKHDVASISLVQRHFNTSYSHAERLLERMEHEGIVTLAQRLVVKGDAA